MTLFLHTSTTADSFLDNLQYVLNIHERYDSDWVICDLARAVINASLFLPEKINKLKNLGK